MRCCTLRLPWTKISPSSLKETHGQGGQLGVQSQELKQQLSLIEEHWGRRQPRRVLRVYASVRGCICAHPFGCGQPSRETLGQKHTGSDHVWPPGYPTPRHPGGRGALRRGDGTQADDGVHVGVLRQALLADEEQQPLDVRRLRAVARGTRRAARLGDGGGAVYAEATSVTPHGLCAAWVDGSGPPPPPNPVPTSASVKQTLPSS